MEHPLGHDEVGDHPVTHRAHDLDAVGRAAHHLVRLAPHGQDPGAVPVDGDERGLVDDDALPADVDQDGRSAEIDAQIHLLARWFDRLREKHFAHQHYVHVRYYGRFYRSLHDEIVQARMGASDYGTLFSRISLD